MAQVALDNDVVAKCATYSLLSEIAATLGVAHSELGVLGTLLFVIQQRHLKTASIGGEAAYQQLQEFVRAAETLEPSEDESRFAAKLEEAALQENLQLDVGESQLCAIVVSREIPVFCTGDKRAIRAIARLVKVFAEITWLAQRVLPFEGLIKRMLTVLGYPRLKGNVCSSRGTDKALEICFQCHREDGNETEAVAGLESYLNAIGKDAPQLFTRL